MSDKLKKLYEVSFLTQSENGVAPIVGHLTKFGAEEMSEGELRKVKLAYPIDKHESAFFGFINCKLPAESISKINEAAKLDKEILRVMVVEPQPNRGSESDVQSDRGPRDSGRTPKQRLSKKEAVGTEALSNELLEEKLEEILQ